MGEVLLMGGVILANGLNHDFTMVSELPKIPFQIIKFSLRQIVQVTDQNFAVFQERQSFTSFSARNTFSRRKIGSSQELDLTQLFAYEIIIRDVGLAPMRFCKRLKKIDVSDTPVTKKDIQEFQKAIPNCETVFDKK